VPDQRQLETPDGTKLHVEAWAPEGDPKCVIVIAHGGAEHVSRYERLAGDFGKLGALCFGPDHRGQGRSEGKRGHIDAFETYTADLLHVMTTQRDELPAGQGPDAIPWFLFGHSMGGLISLTYLLDHSDAIPLRGAIISGPLLGLTMKVNPFKLAMGKMAAVLMPGLSMPSGIPPESICRDPEEVDRYRSDPDRATVVTAGWFGAMQRAIGRVEAEGHAIDLPLLWYAGTGDLICDHTKSVEAFDRLDDPEANDQSLKLFDGYYHEVHNEPEEYRQPAISLITGWVEDRL
jgi:alpha-beta hydrolase superfamily lysophospholipase